MASLVLSGDTSGSITVAAPAVAGSTTQTLVNVTGTLAPIVSGTAITLTNQTAPEFTNIPSWVKRIVLLLSGVSTSGSSSVIAQIGDSGGYETTGYLSVGGIGQQSNNWAVTAFTNSFPIATANAAWSSTAVFNGRLCIENLSGNTWVANGLFYNSTATIQIYTSTGSKTLSDPLDRIRLFIDGTQQFDAGTINILYE